MHQELEILIRKQKIIHDHANWQSKTQMNEIAGTHQTGFLGKLFFTS